MKAKLLMLLLLITTQVIPKQVEENGTITQNIQTKNNRRVTSPEPHRFNEPTNKEILENYR